MSHSKRNTSRSVFTSHERDLAKAAWSSSSARLTRDSFLPFGSCYLCLEIARDPVACAHGDLFCRECALANLLAQKKEIKRLARAKEKAEKDFRDALAREDQEAQARAVKDFETIQAGLEASSSAARPSPTTTARKDPGPSVTTTTGVLAKRKMVLNEEDLKDIADNDRAKARKLLETENSKAKLPSFWTPSQTPGVDVVRTAVLAKAPKANPICPASSDDAQHTYSLKALRSVRFAEDADGETNVTKRVCPSCYKTLGNASRPMMAENCGHVLCRNCIVKFLSPTTKIPGKGYERPEVSPAPATHTCFACDKPLVSVEDASENHKRGLERKVQRITNLEFPGLVELRSEGTGFSARGPRTVEKQGTAFQC